MYFKLPNKHMSWVAGVCLILSLSNCQTKHQEHHGEHEVGTLPVTQAIMIDTIINDEFVCQIHSFQHIELRALEKGYLDKIFIDEGQHVKKGQLLFQIRPTIYQAEVQKAKAELEYARIEYENTKALADSNIVSKSEVALASAILKKAEAELDLSEAHLSFTEIRAPFDGIIGKFEEVRLGSLLDEGELLTTLSDNSKMWVYFNVPEADYLDYVMNSDLKNNKEVSLRLANNRIFSEKGKIETIESDFNNITGNIAFRATFPNPDKILRHGQTGNILWSKDLDEMIAIPQRATFEVLDKQFVFLVEDDKVKSQEIKVAHELSHLYLIDDGIELSDYILIDGLRKVHNGDHIDYEMIETSTVYNALKMHAE